MNITFTIITVIAALVFLLLVLALLVEKKYVIIKSILTNVPQHQVFNLIRYLKNHRQYNVWVQKDPLVKLAYTGNDVEVDAKNSWEGNKQAGKGKQQIIAIDDEKVSLELLFENSFKNIATCKLKQLRCVKIKPK